MATIRDTDDRPATGNGRPSDRPLIIISKMSNGHTSATDHPIHFMLGSRMRFSWTANRMAVFPVRTNPRWRRKWPYLSNGSSGPPTSCFTLNLHLYAVNVLAFSAASQVTAMVAVSTSQIPAANDMYGQFTWSSETTSHHITVDA